MRFTINMEKKYFYLLAGMLSILGIFTVLALATPFNSNIGYHPLQQVTTDQTGATSVDADENLIIDNADKFGGSLPSSFCMSNGTNCPSFGGSSSWATSGSNIYYSLGNVGIGMGPTNTLDVNGVIGALIFEGSNFIDQDDSAYYVDPSSVSVLDTLRVDVIELNGVTSTAISKLRFGGFYSKTGSTCNVPNPAAPPGNGCSCPTGYTDTTIDSSKHICWASDDSLPEVSLTWGPGVLQVVNCVAGPDYGPPDFDLEGQSCSSLGDTNNYDTWGESCGNAITAGYEVKSVRFYTQTCGYY